MAKSTGYSQLTVTCNGVAPIMFDRFMAKDEQERPASDKMYFNPDGSGAIVLPVDNVSSFLMAELGGKSCAALFGQKKRNDYIRALGAYLAIESENDVIPFTRNNKPIVFKGFPRNSDRDDSSGIWIHHGKSLVKKSGGTLIPMPKDRPVLAMPWSITVSMKLFDNPIISADILSNWFQRGGMLIGFGTFRPRYGRFSATVEIK